MENNNLTFKTFELNEDISKSILFNSRIIQAFVGNELIGYAKLVYIDEKNSKKLLEPFDFFIYKVYGSNETIVKLYENNQHKELLETLALKELHLSKEKLNTLTQNEITVLFSNYKETINTIYYSQFKYFQDYWIGKPTIELIRVFSDKDTKYTDYNNDGYPVIERTTLINWRNKGLGIKLYEEIATWCNNSGLALWASTTRTEDANKIWKALENHPKFFISMTHITKTNSCGNTISITERPKLVLK